MPTEALLNKVALSLFILFIGYTATYAQSQLRLMGAGFYAYNSSKVLLNDDEIKASGYGYISGLEYRLAKEGWKVQPALGVAFQHTFTSGTYQSTKFTATTQKVQVLLLADYVLSSKWKAGALIMAENNKDAKPIRDQAAQIIRYSTGVSVSYAVLDRAEVFARYLRSLYPNENRYLFQNPSDKILVGLYITLIK